MKTLVLLAALLIGPTVATHAQLAAAQPAVAYDSPASTVEIYPNPAGAEARVRYQLAADVTRAQVIFYSVLGNVVREIDLQAGRSEQAVSLSELPSGIYFYSLFTDGRKQSTHRLVVKN